MRIRRTRKYVRCSADQKSHSWILTIVPGKTLRFNGTEEEFMEYMDDIYVDCCMIDDDEYYTFDEWAKIYPEEMDYSGETLVVNIIKDGRLVFQNDIPTDEDEDY